MTFSCPLGVFSSFDPLGVILGFGFREADYEEDGYDLGSGFPSALTRPDSPPFQVRILQKWGCMVFWGPSAVLCVR